MSLLYLPMDPAPPTAVEPCTEEEEEDDDEEEEDTVTVVGSGNTR